MSPITVIKLNPAGEETWRYQGSLLVQEDSRIILEAFFDREDRDFHGMPLCRGDRFIETYFTNRWYNIFEIHDRDNDHLRGWYCNIATPAEISDDRLSYIDLALDLLVFPDGKQLILDKDEFDALEVPQFMRQQALVAMKELQLAFENHPRIKPPAG